MYKCSYYKVSFICGISIQLQRYAEVNPTTVLTEVHDLVSLHMTDRDPLSVISTHLPHLSYLNQHFVPADMQLHLFPLALHVCPSYSKLREVV